MKYSHVAMDGWHGAQLEGWIRSEFCHFSDEAKADATAEVHKVVLAVKRKHFHKKLREALAPPDVDLHPLMYAVGHQDRELWEGLDLTKEFVAALPLSSGDSSSV